MTSQIQKAARIDELDGLRALLALWVVVAHIFCWSGFVEVQLPRHGQYVWSQFIWAESAVETFIILSGFAISFLLHARPQPYLQFMTGRFFRLYPVYLICLLAAWAGTCLEPAIFQDASWRNTFYFGGVHSPCPAPPGPATARKDVVLHLLGALGDYRQPLMAFSSGIPAAFFFGGRGGTADSRTAACFWCCGAAARLGWKSR